MSVVILGIETSCDETSAAVLCDGKILSNITASQSIHEAYGGVVPELASRAHQANIVPVVTTALEEAGLTIDNVTSVAFTQGPGLVGALMVGVSYAKGLALALNIPMLAVNHMQAHILAHFIDDPQPKFPFLCLTVSGGHTQIVLVKDYLNMEIIGETIDDAAGEAFDKAAKTIGLPYPGGPLIDKYARKGDKDRFRFAEPQIAGLDFSFSGFKTSVLYFLRDQHKINPAFAAENLFDLCAGIQHTIVGILIKKLVMASKIIGIKEIGIAGGVSANSALRQQILLKGIELGWNVYLPAFEYCTDNAAMIATTGYYKYLNKEFAGLDVVPLAHIPNL